MFAVIVYSLFTDHIFEKLSPAMKALGMECKCLGGGKIEHNSQEKKIRVFGESTVSSCDWGEKKIKAESECVCLNVNYISFISRPLVKQIILSQQKR